MKKTIIIVGAVVAFIAISGFILSSGLTDFNNVMLRGINLAGVPDGSYTGSYENGRWTNTLTVHIADNRITDIDIDNNVVAAFVTNCSDELFSRVIQAQDTKVDAVSGATLTSKAYLKAIEDAIFSASRANASRVEILFDYKKISGSASNQFAIWVEDMHGNFVRTLYATQWTAKGGYKNRPDSIPIWAEKTGLASMSKAEVDAVSSATPQTGALTYTWDLTDSSGYSVVPGEYRFFVEGTLRWKNRVMHSGIIDISGDSAVIEALADYTYEASGRFEALTGDSPENLMIGPVTVRFIPS